MKRLIYIADDEKNIRELIAAFLAQDGFEVRTFENGDALLKACTEKVPDLVVLDIMMPGTDGLAVCSALRSSNPSLAIIIVSAKDSPYDRVTGLTLGSDDYLVKPFLPLELVARVRSLLRRSTANEKEGVLVYGPLRLSTERRSAELDGKALLLTPAEFDFLSYLVRNKDRAVSRDELLREVWGASWDAETRAADDLVKRLRRKLRGLSTPMFIETVWGYGFRIAGCEP